MEAVVRYATPFITNFTSLSAAMPFSGPASWFPVLNQLRAKSFLVLQPRRFEVVRLFLLTRGFFLRALLLLQPYGFGGCQPSFGIGPLGIDDQLKVTGKGRTDQIEGILRIFPSRDGFLPRVI